MSETSDESSIDALSYLPLLAAARSSGPRTGGSLASVRKPGTRGEGPVGALVNLQPDRGRVRRLPGHLGCVRLPALVFHAVVGDGLADAVCHAGRPAGTA